MTSTFDYFCVVNSLEGPATVVFQEWYGGFRGFCGGTPTVCPAHKQCGAYGNANCGNCPMGQVCVEGRNSYCTPNRCP